jgi:hypothetical protein
MDEASLKAAMDEFQHDVHALMEKLSHKVTFALKGEPEKDPKTPVAGGLDHK